MQRVLISIILIIGLWFSIGEVRGQSQTRPVVLPVQADTKKATADEANRKQALVEIAQELKKLTQAQTKVRVANFREPDTKPANFATVIDWGDQSQPTSGQIQTNGRGKSRFSVLGTHRYAAAGVFTITVKIQDAAGRTIATDSSARVIK